MRLAPNFNFSHARRFRLRPRRGAPAAAARAQAIEAGGDEAPPVSESVHIETIVVEDSYDGPRLSWPITAEFVKELTEHLRAQKALHRRYVFEILREAENILKRLPSVFDVPIPPGGTFSVCGDTHGQFYDLLNIFTINGWPSPENPYLFNGDYVDRGSFSFEVVLTMLAMKCLLPDHFHLTRGNHESKTMNKMCARATPDLAGSRRRGSRTPRPARR